MNAERSSSSPVQPPSRRIVFDCPGALALLDPTAVMNNLARGVGGAEVRALTFAKWLMSTHGYQTSFVVASEAVRRSRTKADGLTIHFEPRRIDLGHGPIRWLNQSRQTMGRIAGSLVKRIAGVPESRGFYRQFDWDVLIAMGVTNRTASLVRTAQQLRRPCIVCLTTDRTLQDARRCGRRDRGIYGEQGVWIRYALRHASAIVTQTALQRESLEDLGVNSTWIPNPIDLTQNVSATHSEEGSEPGDASALSQLISRLPTQPYVLWIGRADTFSKRADLAIEIARQSPHVPFVMVMNRHDDACYRRLVATMPANVVLIEHVQYQLMDHVYRRAGLLLNTSAAEGFPNSFLQSGKHGVPVVSLRVDPDQVLTQQRVGLCCHDDLALACATVDRWLRVSAERDHYSLAIRAYVQRVHDLQHCGERLAQLLNRVHRSWQSANERRSVA